MSHLARLLSEEEEREAITRVRVEGKGNVNP